jgi:2-oxoglutarate ferredoxin oxidoreductase subunit delta
MSTTKIHISAEVCKGCGLCTFYCPKAVLRLSTSVNSKGYRVVEAAKPDQCSACRLCETNCPDLALFIESQFRASLAPGNRSESEDPPVPRP